MASTDPFSSSQSFTNLLFSQEEITTPETYPQPSREARVRWSVPEERAPASAWINTLKDPIVSNEQRAEAFWDRVAVYFAACPAVSKLTIRDSNTCKQKWQKMNESVMKFAGCYEYASRIPRSGETEDSVLLLAYKLYFQDQKAKFTLEHVWRILKTEQKWCSFCTEKSKPPKKKTKVNDGSAFSSSSNAASQEEGDNVKRPIGVKAAKALAKKKGKGKSQGCKSVDELQSLWDIKEKDLAVKERRSK